MISKEQYEKANKLIREFREQQSKKDMRICKLIAYKLSQLIPNCCYIVIRHTDYEDGSYSYEIARKRKHIKYQHYSKKENVICGSLIKKYEDKVGFYTFWVN